MEYKMCDMSFLIPDSLMLKKDLCMPHKIKIIRKIKSEG